MNNIVIKAVITTSSTIKAVMIKSPVIIRPSNAVGPQGPGAPNVMFQYSVDSIIWTDQPEPGVMCFRISTDGGLTWTDPILFGNTINSYFEFSRAPYAPHVEFEFEFVAHGNPGYAFPPFISVGLEYDPLVQHDGSFPSPPNITPVIGLVTQEISGILRYRGFTVHWVGNVVPETLPNTYVSAIAMIPKQ